MPDWEVKGRWGRVAQEGGGLNGRQGFQEVGYPPPLSPPKKNTDRHTYFTTCCSCALYDVVLLGRAVLQGARVAREEGDCGVEGGGWRQRQWKEQDAVSD